MDAPGHVRQERAVEAEDAKGALPLFDVYIHRLASENNDFTSAFLCKKLELMEALPRKNIARVTAWLMGM